jgi:chromosome segregation ATPase
MTGPIRFGIFLLLVATPWAPPTGLQAQPPPPAALGEPAAVAAEIQRLNTTLARIVTLLERQIEGQRLDLELKRLEVASRRVDALEEDLARARSSRTGLANERFGMESRLETLPAEVDQANPDSLPMLEVMTRQVESHLERLDAQIAEADARILELENELTRRRQDIQALEDRLDRELDGLK